MDKTALHLQRRLHGISYPFTAPAVPLTIYFCPQIYRIKIGSTVRIISANTMFQSLKFQDKQSRYIVYRHNQA